MDKVDNFFGVQITLNSFVSPPTFKFICCLVIVVIIQIIFLLAHKNRISDFCSSIDILLAFLNDGLFLIAVFSCLFCLFGPFLTYNTISHIRCPGSNSSISSRKKTTITVTQSKMNNRETRKNKIVLPLPPSHRLRTISIRVVQPQHFHNLFAHRCKLRLLPALISISLALSVCVGMFGFCLKLLFKTIFPVFGKLSKPCFNNNPLPNKLFSLYPS